MLPIVLHTHQPTYHPSIIIGVVLSLGTRLARKSFYIANRIKKETINANNPVASAKAKPKIAYENNWPLSAGFRATPVIREPKTVPMPVPAPMSPAAAAPAPISLPAPMMAAPTVMVSVTTPRDWPRAMLEAVLRSMARLMMRPELRVAGWNREIEVDGPGGID